jgi:hypothetical protein
MSTDQGSPAVAIARGHVEASSNPRPEPCSPVANSPPRCVGPTSSTLNAYITDLHDLEGGEL